MSMKLEETPIYKTYEEVMNKLYHLEDITQYENKRISKAIKHLQKIDIKKLCEKNYIIINK